MNNKEIKSTIEKYINLIEGNEEVSIESFIQVLDELAYSMHFVKFEYDDTDYPDVPDKTYEHNRAIVEKRFPDFGHFNLADKVTSSIGDCKIHVGDAIDDITDIYSELKETLWRWDNNSEADALWYFEDMYGFHWRSHLRKLQYYLNEYNDEYQS